ncbi:alpha/beta fold hydrolase [Bacillus cereus]|uniref:alpha/beta fold hydrolase n=1 Tax=Bacillus cereus TaxID=1396 RepID=UPI0001A0AC3C|nr:prolyl aminopeptidase [Bacillus cereus Rock3-44]
MEEHFIETSGCRLWTAKQGRGIPVLLISGGPGCADYLEPVASLIDDICEVVRFDPRGCGRSESYDTGYGVKECIEDMERIREHYKIEKWIVMGHSWGADLALAYAILQPNSLLGLISISGTGIQNDRDWKRAYEEGVKGKRETCPDSVYSYNKEVHRSLINSWREYMKRPHILKDISMIEVPTLFVYGQRDIRPSWPILQIATLINGAKAIEIEEAEHYIWMQNESRLREELRKYVSESF